MCIEVMMYTSNVQCLNTKYIVLWDT
jgi:hypothetical protein